MLGSPHRPFFSAAALVWLLVAGWWAWRWVGAEPAEAGLIPSGLLHGWVMSLGFMPLFIAGFALTTVPRWLDWRAPPPAELPGLALAAAAGWALLLIGNALAQRGEVIAVAVAVVGAALPALVLGVLAVRLWRWCRAAGVRPSGHAQGLALGLAVLALSQAGAALALALHQPLGVRLAVHAGLSFGVAGVFALALQRLTPFLHEQGRRQPRFLVLLLAGLALRGGLELAGLRAWTPPPMLGGVFAAMLLGLANILWRDAWRPELAGARRMPLVAQLHLGYVWLAVSLALEAGALLAAALGRPGLLGLAPVHALSLGFMGSTWLAMVSRVTAVQQGRSVAADAGLWALQVLLQAVALMRLAAEMVIAATLAPMPFDFSIRLRPTLLTGAAAGFALLALLWCLRYLPWLLRPPVNKRMTR
ncbi:NnrS family protein [Roseateles koreensis]|uniref:NnrS family protein n=1 Tax=Roseateles koreensis TaxID=2987526 RepID=A0ABT5KU02_9BURK|nr:NnrS family protein [Roseateles koreensis]MDC8786418.1 NnrS family protein [Roseateles koreensis]